jgi:hypothetical protein
MEGVFHEGELAFSSGIPMIDNPYVKYSDCWYRWQDGWKQRWFEDLRRDIVAGKI